ncbi:hypothetical protein BC940DRAFT_300245 [Gongronella butleri]|nr:hypothetical protein BC940DRAFT_300245 [Gongronella butleri]
MHSVKCDRVLPSAASCAEKNRSCPFPGTQVQSKRSVIYAKDAHHLTMRGKRKSKPASPPYNTHRVR